MQAVLSASLMIYIACYAFESVVRYGLNLVGADVMIFVRDLVLGAPILGLFLYQFFRGKVHPAYWMYLFAVALHGIVIMLNIGSAFAVAYGAKILLTMLAGAVMARTIFAPSKRVLLVFFFLWATTAVGVTLDKYFVEWPWSNMETTIGDIQVDISRDWEVRGEDKRAGGFARSSIHVANLEPILALILLVYARRYWQKLAIIVITLPTLYFTTQKGAILAFLIVVGLLAVRPKHPVRSLQLGYTFLTLTAILLPVILPGYNMPHAEGVFSFSSFYERIESMWPRAWHWISHHDAFPFGVGLGGIAGAQRVYAPFAWDAADNIYIFMYAYFGMMTFVYIGWATLQVYRTRQDAPPATVLALATLTYLAGYGIVLSIIEDQMGSLFLAGSVVYLWHEVKRDRAERGKLTATIIETKQAAEMPLLA